MSSARLSVLTVTGATRELRVALQVTLALLKGGADWSKAMQWPP